MTSRARSGATLLEALVALAIAALVLTGVYGALTRASIARRDATAAADRIAVQRAVLVHLATELAAAPRAAPDDPAARRFALEAPPDGVAPWSALRFATLAAGAPRTLPGGDVRVIGYRVEPARDAGSGTLVRVESAVPSADANAGVATPLVTGVRALRVRATDGTEWRTTWAAADLPRAVDVALAVDDGRGGASELSTTVALPAAR